MGRQITSILACLVLLCPFAALANKFGLSDVFNNLHINQTAASKYQDSAAGWYSGGSTVIRTKNTALQPFSVTAPSIKTGCGGIDLYKGSFSIVSGNQIVDTAKGFLTEAPSYGFHLAMKTYAPQIEQTLKDLRTLTMQINQFSLGHCKTTQAAFAAILPKKTAIYEKVCEEMAGGSGHGEGYFSNRSDSEPFRAGKRAYH